MLGGRLRAECGIATLAALSSTPLDGITVHFYKIGRAAADDRSRPNRIATFNAATPRAGIFITET